MIRAMPYNSRLLAASLSTALACSSLARGQELACDPLQVAVSTTPIIEQSPGKLKAAIAAGIAKNTDADLMVVGDSLAAGWQEFADRDFPGRTVHWFGVRGERTQELLWRIQHYSPAISPRHIVLIVGTNNLSDRTATPCGVASGVIASVASLEHVWPGASIIVVPILPRGEGFDFRRSDRGAINDMLRERYGTGAKVTVMDVDDDELTCNQKLAECPNYRADRLHLSGDGYRVLAQWLPR